MREHGSDGGSVVDMRMDFEHAGVTYLSVGGSWSRKEERFVGDAASGVVVRFHPGQRTGVEWFARWIAVHAGRRDTPPGDLDLLDEVETDPSEVFSAMLAGGRRSGKTWIAAAICAAYAVAFPGAIVWAVSPSRGRDDTKANEIRRYMAKLLAPEWIRRQTIATGWELINGSSIMLKSAHTSSDPDAIKEGEAHLVWLNEGQKMSRRVYVVARGAIADKSGLVLVCANPPVEAKDEQWVSDFASDAEIGRRASAYFHFDPLANPFINRKALLELKREVDARTFDIEVRGMFLGAKDAVAHNWIRTENERATPRPEVVGNVTRACPVTGLVDVTSTFLELIEEGDGITDLVGLDVQRIPYIGGPIYRIYCWPDEEPTRDNVIAWIVGEVVLDGGDEVDWCGALPAHGLRPDSTLIICDASGRYQHSRRRNVDSPPPSWTGRGSFDIIRGEGWNRIVSPSRLWEAKNPSIQDRMRAYASMICNAESPPFRRLFCDRDRAPRCIEAIRGWRNVYGKPSRSNDLAHLGDGISYPLIRLFPRLQRSGNTGPMPHDPIAQRVDHQEHDALVAPPRRSSGRGTRGRGL